MRLCEAAGQRFEKCGVGVAKMGWNQSEHELNPRATGSEKGLDQLHQSIADEVETAGCRDGMGRGIRAGFPRFPHKNLGIHHEDQVGQEGVRKFDCGVRPPTSALG